MSRPVIGLVIAIMTAVLLAVGVGRVLPRGDQLLFSSSNNWQAGAWNIFVMDISRGMAQRLLTTRTDTVPGYPVVWSPDGVHLAFMANSTHFETYLVDPQGQNSRRLGGDNVYDLAWSPDSRWLAFISDQDGGRDVFLASADGTSPRNMTDGRDNFRSLAWSPGGDALVGELLARGDIDIARVDIATGQLNNLTRSPGNDIRPAWSPDGRQIAFLSSRNSGSFGNTRYDLYIMGSDGSHVRRLTYNTLADTSWGATWSPDGRRIAFGSLSWGGGGDVFIIDVPHGLARNVTRDSSRDGSPAWSPDGSQIAFESRKSGHWEIYLVSADGWKRKQLTSGTVDSRRPVWSPDGQQVLFVSNPHRNWDLYMVDIHQSIVQRITYKRSIDFSPVWRPPGS